MSRIPDAHRFRRGLATVATCSLLALAAACGSSSSDGGSTSLGSASGAGAISPSVEDLKMGTEQTPPTTGPKPKSGLKLVYVSCGQVAPGCAGPGVGLENAAKELGWTVTTVDGKFNAGGGYSTAFHQAIALEPDAIATAGIDCAQVKQSVADAKAAGIPVLSWLGADCDADGGEKLWGADIVYNKDAPTTAEWYSAWGVQKVQYLEAKLGGKVRLINVRFNDALPSLNEGVESAIADCADCKIVADVAVGTADAANPQGPIVAGVKAALLQHPDANALLVPADTQLMATGLLQALRNSPQGKELIVTGGEGSPSGIEALDQGPIPTAIIGYSNEWIGWALADSINRLLNDSPQVAEGFGARVIEKGENPADGAYQAKVDFQSAYKQAWGITQ
jgi:ribose transport system substrate-binding protein